MALREDGVLWLSNSEIEEFQRCARGHWWGSVQRLEPNEPPNPLKAAEVGTRVHTACERYYRGTPAEEVIAALQADVDHFAETVPDGDQQKAAELVLAIFEGYVDWLAETGADQGLTGVQAESTWTRTLPEFPDVVFAGKIDLETDEALIDFKTTKIAFSVKLRTLQRARQLVHYAWLMEPLRYVNRVRVRVMRQSTRSDRTTGPYYVEEEIPVTRRRLRVHEDQLRELVPLIRANYERTTLPLSAPGEDCSWKCPFYLACGSADQGEDYQALLSEGFHQGDPDARYREGDEE